MHLINRLRSKVLNFNSLIDLLEERFPNVKLKTSLPVKVFGCVCYVHNPKHKQNKWNAKALKCVFLGYSTTQKGYKVHHPLTQRYIVSKDVLFEEKFFYYKPMGNESHREMDKILISEENQLSNDSPLLVDAQPNTIFELKLPQIPNFTDNDSSHHLPTSADDTQVIVPYPKYYQRQKKGKKPVEGKEITVPNEDNNTVSSSEPLASTIGGDEENQNQESLSNQNSGYLSFEQGGDDLPIALRKGIRTWVKPIPFAVASYLDYHKVSPQYKAFLTQIQEIPIPKTPQEALTNIRCKEAMDEEMRALLQNDTWEIVDLPRDKKIVGCRWYIPLSASQMVL